MEDQRKVKPKTNLVIQTKPFVESEGDNFIKLTKEAYPIVVNNELYAIKSKNSGLNKFIITIGFLFPSKWSESITGDLIEKVSKMKNENAGAIFIRLVVIINIVYFFYSAFLFKLDSVVSSKKEIDK